MTAGFGPGLVPGAERLTSPPKPTLVPAAPAPRDPHEGIDTPDVMGGGWRRGRGSGILPVRPERGRTRLPPALSGPSEEEVCRVDSSRQVNSNQMGPRYLPGDTRRAGFAQPGRLFALGTAFPSVGRQQRGRDVTAAAQLGSSVTGLAGCLHPGWHRGAGGGLRGTTTPPGAASPRAGARGDAHAVAKRTRGAFWGRMGTSSAGMPGVAG